MKKIPLPRRLAVAALVAAAAAAPFAQPASATVCKGWTVSGVASAGACDEDDYWVWCAGVSVQVAGGVSACQPQNRPGVWVGCWTPSGLHCN